MQAAIDAGVNFFDTAPMYGDGASEELLGEFMHRQGLRNQIILATKIRPHRMRAEEIVVECNDSLRRLKTDYIDLYQTHWTNREVPLEETWGAMQSLQQQGKVRQIGVCNMGLGDLSEIRPHQLPLTNQLPYNLLWRAIEHSIVPYCIEAGIGMLVYSPLMHGILAGNYADAASVPDGRARSRHFSSARPLSRHGEPGCESETFAAVNRIREIARQAERSMAEIALAWTIQQPGVASVIAGARTESQLRENVSFLENPLSDDTLAQLNRATEELKQILGTNADMWDGTEKSRYR
jgi:aryl-alcohol dehydrogenase-like predicted oxidoreductase